MSDPNSDIKQRNREIAENESVRQTTSAIRVSGWAMGVTVLIVLAVFGWVFLGR